MLFMYIHTHPVEKCIADKPQEIASMFAKAQEETKKAGIKIIGNYTAPHEHTLFMIFETDDLPKLERVLVPMTVWGNARLIPLTPVQDFIKR